MWLQGGRHAHHGGSTIRAALWELAKFTARLRAHTKRTAPAPPTWVRATRAQAGADFLKEVAFKHAF
jgi:hypothetical protein